MASKKAVGVAVTLGALVVLTAVLAFRSGVSPRRRTKGTPVRETNAEDRLPEAVGQQLLEEERTPIPPNAVVNFTPEKNECFLGEPTYVRFTLSDSTGEGFVFATGSDYRGASRPLRFKFRAWEKDGKEVADPDPGEMCVGGIGWDQPVTPDETYSRMLLLQSWCHFESPGTYRVGAAADLGWGEADPEWSTTFARVPFGEFTITLVEATPEQAKAVLDAMVDDLMSNEQRDWEEQHEPAFHLIRFDVYLPHLVDLTSDARKKVREAAIDGLHSILSVETTWALIRLLDHSDSELRLKVAQTLNWRLPDPELQGKLGARSPFRFWDEEKHKRAIRLSWRDGMAVPVLKWAKDTLRSKNAKQIQIAAFMLECLGGPEDLPLIADAIDKVAEGWARWPEKGEYEASGAANELIRAAEVILKNGARPVGEPKTAGEAVIWASALGVIDDFRPAGWQERAAALLRHPVALVRSTVLNNMADNLPEEVRERIPSVLRDPDRSVRYAVCEVLQRSGDKEFLKDVVNLLRVETHEWNIRAAVNAAHVLGGKGAYVDTLVERLDDMRVCHEMMDHLGNWVIRPKSYHGSGRSGKASKEEAERAKALWKSWLRKYREDVLKENGFPAGDSRLEPGLFLTDMHFYLPGGERWPPKEPESDR